MWLWNPRSWKNFHGRNGIYAETCRMGGNLAGRRRSWNQAVKWEGVSPGAGNEQRETAQAQGSRGRSSWGNDGQVLGWAWFPSHLSGCSFSVSFAAFFLYPSQRCTLRAGVPWGSVLAPFSSHFPDPLWVSFSTPEASLTIYSAMGSTCVFPAQAPPPQLLTDGSR